MRSTPRRTVVAILLMFSLAAGVRADPATGELEHLAADTARRLASLCPVAAKDDVTAHAKCAAALREASFIPFASQGLLFGADQPDTGMSKKQLTHLQSPVFQLLYLSLFSFTGNWSVTMDSRDNVAVLRIEAYFRNALPPGEFPYPFWHSAAKWNDYENANELKFWLNNDGEIFAVTRSANGSNANRGPWAHVTPPAFDGQWQWTDAGGQPQPHVSLFSNRYSADNPWLPPLDKAYRNFAGQAREGTCLNCHAPTNKAGMGHLVLLQTPVHAAGEIDRVLKEVRSGEMPEDEYGLRASIDPELRAAIVATGEVFRQTLRNADQWEAEQHH